MGTFVVRTASDGQAFFNLKAANGETILTSEMYKSKAGALKGIESVKANASTDERYERKTAAGGKCFFVLKAANHEVIGKSEMYTSEAARDKGIESVKSNAPKAGTKDETKS